MSNLGLFVMGSLVTLLVAGSIGLLVWGAILDGRYQDERQAAERDAVESNFVSVAGPGRVVSKPSDAPRTIEVLAPTRAAPASALADHGVVVPEGAGQLLPAVAHATSDTGADRRLGSR